MGGTARSRHDASRHRGLRDRESRRVAAGRHCIAASNGGGKSAGASPAQPSSRVNPCGSSIRVGPSKGRCVRRKPGDSLASNTNLGVAGRSPSGPPAMSGTPKCRSNRRQGVEISSLSGPRYRPSGAFGEFTWTGGYTRFLVEARQRFRMAGVNSFQKCSTESETNYRLIWLSCSAVMKASRASISGSVAANVS